MAAASDQLEFDFKSELTEAIAETLAFHLGRDVPNDADYAKAESMAAKWQKKRKQMGLKPWR